MSNDVPAFKVSVFASDNWILNWSKGILVADIPTQILLAIFLFIDPSSRKLKDHITHTKEKPSTQVDTFHKISKAVKEPAKLKLDCLLLIFIYSNSNVKVFCKYMDMNAGISDLIEKPSHISNISSTILFFIRKNTQTEWSYSNWMVITLGIY